MAKNSGASSYEQENEPQEVKDSPHVKAAREAAEIETQNFLDANEEELRTGTDGDRRRIRLHAKQAGNKKYEEELTTAIEETEADKDHLISLLSVVQADTERMLEELQQLKLESDQQ